MRLTAEDRRSERRLILDGSFPAFPALPVKRYREGLETGIILWVFVPGEGNDRQINVYRTNIFDCAARFRGRAEKPTWKEVLEGVPRLQYAGFDAFFDDGWMAD